MININYTGRQTNISDEIRDFCEKRIKSTEKLISSPAEVDIILSVEKYRHKVEIHISSKGFNLNAAEETRDMISSLGLAFDNIERQCLTQKREMSLSSGPLRNKIGRFYIKGKMETWV